MHVLVALECSYIGEQRLSGIELLLLVIVVIVV